MSDVTQLPWDVRAARNQAVFRAINDELQQQQERRNGDPLTISCECADTECVEQLELGTEEYARVRSEPTHFAVLPEHVYPEVERVVSEHDGYVVVGKIDDAARIAAGLASDTSDA